MVPTECAAMAKRPRGINRPTNWFARARARSAIRSESISFCLPSTPMSAMPRTALKRTTAGTMLLARELNGLAGM